MRQKTLTGQQEKVLKFVDEFLNTHGFPPTLREIGDAVHLVNINAVRGHLTALEKKGYINKTPEKARSIQLVHTPTIFSRLKRKIHEVLGTDKGVFHRIIYGLGWTTRLGKPIFLSPRKEKMKAIIEREATEHGWDIHDLKIEPDHIVLVVEVWPNHSPEQTVKRIQNSANAIKQFFPANFSGNTLWGQGYVATTDLELLDTLMEKLLEKETDIK